jgi:glyceraldehyde 3-phosphate dehydrogenase
MSEALIDDLGDWRADEELAESMIPILGRLYREHDVIVYIFGRKLIRSSIDIIKAHRYARQYIGDEIAVGDSFPLLQAIDKLALDSAKVDLGKLTVAWLAAQADGATDIDAFVAEQLSSITTGQGRLLTEPTDVVLYGFGRIGRLLARILIDRTGSGSKLRLRAIVLRPGKDGDVEKRASLLRRDSIHGPFNGTITADPENSQIIANGNPIKLIYAKNPDDIDYADYGIKNAIVVDNTGMWRDADGLGQHLKSNGVARVLLTAPGKGEVKNIIYGVNNEAIRDDDNVVSAASCTTNAIVPTLKVINDTFGIENGHLETVHAFTNDQNLTDNFHKASRRGRAAPLNMVITETGAATAVAKALPELDGKLTGNAIRVPIPNVSLAILNLNLDKETTKDELNATLREASLSVDLGEQIDYTSSTELVSSDLVGAERASIVDSQATIVDGDRCVLYVWYDNEAGYSYQVVRIVQQLAGLDYPRVP